MAKDFKTKHFWVMATSDGFEIQANYPDTSNIFVPNELVEEFADMANRLRKAQKPDG